MPVDYILCQQASIEVVPFDEDQADACGILKASSRPLGLSLGDCACLALAKRRGVPALTADRLWSQLGTDHAVVVIR